MNPNKKELLFNLIITSLLGSGLLAYLLAVMEDKSSESLIHIDLTMVAMLLALILYPIFIIGSLLLYRLSLLLNSLLLRVVVFNLLGAGLTVGLCILLDNRQLLYVQLVFVVLTLVHIVGRIRSKVNSYIL